MFPCCWIAALIVLFSSIGVSFANLKIGLVLGLFALASILVLKKLKKNKGKSCCSK